MLDAAAPTGTVTFLFSDIEGSTVRWDSHREAMQAAVRRHDEILRAAIERNGGFVFKTIGDAFCAAFPGAEGALAATLETQRAISSEDWSEVGGLRVRMALHSGVADERNNDYFGPTVNRVARLLSIGHGGQVLVSGAARSLIDERYVQNVALLDLGMHRLKDLSAPEHVFQLTADGLASEFPSLKSLDAVPNNLPAQLAPLVGRDEELTAIKGLVGNARLVTLLGPGGIGKTRIALQVAAEFARADGAWFVDLASYDDASLVASAIAEALNIVEDGGSRPPIDRVVAALKSKDLLIVLDNCEHLIGASARTVEQLLRSCPDVRVLATTREALGISGEEVFRMPSLSLPPSGAIGAEEAMRYGAAALFVTRARASAKFEITDDNAELVCEIVRRLDGIALAIELAAARVKVLSLAALLKRLDDRLTLLTGGSRTALPRQQTLRALIAWSYDLLSDVERSVLQQLAVFRGTFSLEAAEAVWSDAENDGDALDLVAALADKSLLVAETSEDEQRYRLLESTREFALEKLAESENARAVAARHCEFYARCCAALDSGFWKTDADAWSGDCKREIDNVRAAIAWGFEDAEHVEIAAMMVANLRWYWWATARGEGRRLLERGTSLLSTTTAATTRALVSLARGALADSGAQAIEAASDAVALFGEKAAPALRAEALVAQADATLNGGAIERALSIAQEAVAAARAAREPREIGWTLSTAAYAFACAGDSERALSFFNEAEPLIRRSNDRPAIARMQMIRAELYLAEGATDAALACVNEAETIYRERRNESWLCTALLNKAAYLLVAGDSAGAQAAAREGLQLARSREDDFTTAIAVGHLGRIAAERGQIEAAARLIGFVDAVYARIGSSREPTEQRGYDRSLELIRASLREERVQALLAEGATSDAETAAADALAIAEP